jgi:N-acetylneuraminic acid mutarotase
MVERLRSNVLNRLWLRIRRGSQPAAEREWHRLAPAPSRRLDAGAIQIGHLLYCFAGYESQDQVVSAIDVFDLASCSWVKRMAMPPEVPQSHFALSCEANRYFYLAAGQLGPRCSPAVASVFVWDVVENAWHSLPALPEPRYAPTMQFFDGRLHLIGGAESDRYTPVKDHLSLGVSGGRALDEWRVETPIPRGGMHRCSAVVNDRLFILGGQEGDFVPVPGDPKFGCDGNTVEVIYPDVYEWSEATNDWIRLPDMPIPSSHNEYSLIVEGDLIFINGGSCNKDPQTFAIELTDAIQVFDTRKHLWTIGGRLPFRVKTCLAASYDGWLYICGGQRDLDANDSKPGAIENSAWRARINA